MSTVVDNVFDVYSPSVTTHRRTTIRDVATFEDPMHYSVGIRHVLVNGKLAVRDGRLTSEHAGRALRGPGYKGK